MTIAEFGKRVRSARKRSGLTQEQLADRAGLHRTFIGSIERGERNISLLNLWRLAGALGVSPCELICEDAA